MFKEPPVKKDGICNSEPCPCYDGLIVHRSPMLYDIIQDPSENKPIDFESGIYKDKQSKMSKELVAFQADIAQNSMIPQFDSKLGNLPLPWLQPFKSV